MSPETMMSIMGGAEFVLSTVLAYLFWKRKLRGRFPAMGAYLALHAASTPVLLFLFQGDAHRWFNDYCFIAYFSLYWAVYIASAILLFFICMEIFRSALAAFPGLMKLGILVFRWAALVSVFVSLAAPTIDHRTIFDFVTGSFPQHGVLVIPAVAYALMRSVSMLELCLLAFLCLSMNALRLSARDLAFGISLGFGIMSANDFIQSAVDSIHTSLTAPWQFVFESVILVGFGTWMAYFLLPEPVRKPMVVPINSTIYRWNEIASALGHTGTQVAVQQSANSFFLTDVEKVVEKVLSRNLKDRESES